MLNYTEIERDVLAAGKVKNAAVLESRKQQVLQAQRTLDYQMTRFMEQFGNKLDLETNDKYHHFYRVKCEEYSRVSRLLRVITAVSK